jgi:hypothetical protein
MRSERMKIFAQKNFMNGLLGEKSINERVREEKIASS